LRQCQLLALRGLQASCPGCPLCHQQGKSNVPHQGWKPPTGRARPREGCSPVLRAARRSGVRFTRCWQGELLPIAGKKPPRKRARKSPPLNPSASRHRRDSAQQRLGPRGQPRGRVCLKWKPFGVNLLATARTSRSHVSSAIFWASITSPIGRAPIGMKHNPSCRQPLSSISHTFTEAPAWILYRFPLSFPMTSK
jgi:hypothetical protein